ncbi:MAG TPA: response regulator [Candidatus Margulisiibacteriota bacterium]|nr:response regulator [Candidatus Margulisiibacteriota bacterium]
MPGHGPVLVVDDDPNILEVMQRLFESIGHGVVTAANGDEAMRRLQSGLVPCLIILDLDMPVKDGISFRREQLADPILARFPVIILSSRHDVEQIAGSLQAAAYFTKSRDLDALLPLVADHCLREPPAPAE